MAPESVVDGRRTASDVTYGSWILYRYRYVPVGETSSSLDFSLRTRTGWTKGTGTGMDLKGKE